MKQDIFAIFHDVIGYRIRNDFWKLYYTYHKKKQQQGNMKLHVKD